jgi:hypothetical protein
MLIPQLSVGTNVVVFKLIRLLNTLFVYLSRDRYWVIEFIFVGYWFVSFVIPCIHSANKYYIVL